MDLFLPQRLVPLLGITGAVASSVVYHVVRQHKQFYPSMVALAASNINMLCVYSFLAMLFCAGIRAVRLILFGEARPIERERLFERAWFAFTETLLAMTIFRDEFNAQLITLFAFLLAMKCLHWLLQDRVEFMQQTPNFSWVFHLRCVTTSAFLLTIDVALVGYAVYMVYLNGPSIQLLFGFEYLIQIIMVVATFIKYVLFVIEMRSADPWEARPIYLAYINLFIDFLRLAVYVVFFLILFNYYSFPLHILRELFVTATSFLKRLNDIVRARRATANLNTRYPDATPEELAEDSMCTICREEMQSGKRLHCGHIFHLGCLRSWLQQNQTCPTCRADMLVLEQQQAQPAAAQPGNAAGPAAQPAAQHGQNQAGGQAGPAGLRPAADQATIHGGRDDAGPAGVAAGEGAGQHFVPPPPPYFAPGGPWAAPGLQPPAYPWMAGMPPPPIPDVTQGDGENLAPPPFMPFGWPGAAPGFGMAPPGFMPFEFDADDEPPLDLLSDRELEAMEGQEREKLMRRIEFLRQFRQELDAMLARFGQYEQLANSVAAAAAAGSAAAAAAAATAATLPSSADNTAASPTADASVAGSASLIESSARVGAESAADSSAANVGSAATPPALQAQAASSSTAESQSAAAASQSAAAASPSAPPSAASTSTASDRRRDDVREQRLRKLSQQEGSQSDADKNKASKL